MREKEGSWELVEVEIDQALFGYTFWGRKKAISQFKACFRSDSKNSSRMSKMSYRKMYRIGNEITTPFNSIQICCFIFFNSISNTPNTNTNNSSTFKSNNYKPSNTRIPISPNSTNSNNNKSANISNSKSSDSAIYVNPSPTKSNIPNFKSTTIKSATSISIIIDSSPFNPTPPLSAPVPLPILPRPILCLQDTQSYARTIDTLLDTSVNYPKLLELYLNYEIRTLLNVSLEVLKHVSINERIHYLTRLFFKYPIIFDELHIICFICICKLDFHWLPESEQIKIKESQKIGYKKVEKENVKENRLFELINLSEHCLNIFNALIKLP